MKKLIKDTLKIIDSEINKPLYDSLSDYLIGIRDILNILYDRDYINIEESREYILEKIKEIEIL